MKKYKFVIVGVVLFYGLIFFPSSAPPLPSPKTPVCLYSKNLKELFCKAIQEAKTEILLQMYALSDQDLIDLLEKKAQEGVKVEILFDKTAAKPKLHFCQTLPNLAKGLMHRKILLIDQKLLFIGSANMTEQSLKMHDNLVLGLYQKNLDGIILLPDKQGLSTLIQELDRAKRKIRVALFTLTHPQIVDALIAAKNRGVSVKCAIDHYTANGASKKQVERLKKEGIPVRLSQGLQLFHHKWAFIDNETLIHGSANWTKAAFTKNYDCFIILSNLGEKQKKTLKRIWKKIRWETEEAAND